LKADRVLAMAVRALKMLRDLSAKLSLIEGTAGAST
jgi:hypothetical protein